MGVVENMMTGEPPGTAPVPEKVPSKPPVAWGPTVPMLPGEPHDPPPSHSTHFQRHTSKECFLFFFLGILVSDIQQ